MLKLNKIRQKEDDSMPDLYGGNRHSNPHILKRAACLALVFLIIIVLIFLIRLLPTKASKYSDPTKMRIEEEMAANQIVFSSGSSKRTVVDFQEPIVTAHGKETKLIVHRADVKEKISIADEGLGGWKWTSAYQDIVFKGHAEYTVDLSRLTEKDFMVNNETKELTVRIPYAVLSLINIPDDEMEFHETKSGWLHANNIKLTPEENSQIRLKAEQLMKAKLIDDNIIAAANDDAKIVVGNLLSATVNAIDPEFTIIIVQ